MGHYTDLTAALKLQFTVGWAVNCNALKMLFCVLKKKIDSKPEICYNEPESLMPENKEDHL